MIIIETCPKCGHDLTDLIIATNPPIPQKKCFGCGWEWTGEREEVVRVPFNGNSLIVDDLVKLEDCTTLNIADYNNAITNTMHIDWDSNSTEGSNQSPCDGCSNNPKNGGSGVCNCILGRTDMTC